MVTKIRRASREDIEVCGEICYRAFCQLADHHKFPHEFPDLEAAHGVVRGMISDPGHYGIVAELNGRIAGSNFMDERSTIAGIGPISVDPDVQNSGAGRAMMQHMLDRVAAESIARRPAGADRLSQSIPQPVREARLRNPRAACR